MTTQRRELRQAILPILQSYNTHDEELLADEIADAVLEIVNKKPEKPTKDPMWNFLHGIDLSQEEIEDNKLVEEAKISFEMHMKFNPLPWSSTQVWTKFEKFVVEQYKKDKLIFAKYKTWQQGDGKFVAMTNRKIRENPQIFIDCFPDFVANTVIYNQPRTEEQKQMFSIDDNDLPISY